MSNAITGKGTIFNRWDGSQWVPIAEINSISGPTMSRETVDVTTLGSAGGYREFIGSLRDGGDVSLNMNFTAATYALMKADFEDDTVQQYQIVLPDTANTTLELDGIVTEMPLDIPLDDKVTCDITIKVSGETDLTTVLYILSVVAIVDIAKSNGTQLAGVSLPATVTANLDDGSTASVVVTWDTGTPTYDGDTNGTYTFSGTLTPTTGIINPNNVKATVDVVIS